MQRILVTGATGFIGGHLVRRLAARGDAVVALTRSPAAAELPEGVTAERWTPSSEGDWLALLNDRDAVVHLAGEQAVGVRWTDETKRRVTASRVKSTELLIEGMRRAERRPRVFLCASAVGYYGAREGDEELTEASAAGADFLAELTTRWEAAAREAEELGVRVVRARFGIVLGAGGGALEQMAKPFRMLAGGPIGSGKQVVSWISVDDTVRALCQLLDDDSISGAVNVVAPHPVTNEELADALGKQLGKPSWLRVPAAALRLRFGEGAEPLLTGQRVRPVVLEQAGFSWHHPDIASELSAALGSH